MVLVLGLLVYLAFAFVFVALIEAFRFFSFCHDLIREYPISGVALAMMGLAVLLLPIGIATGSPVVWIATAVCAGISLVCMIGVMEVTR